MKAYRAQPESAGKARFATAGFGLDSVFGARKRPSMQ